jgi:hypothetical protein
MDDVGVERRIHAVFNGAELKTWDVEINED